MKYTKDIIEKTLNGAWHNAPTKKWYVDSVAINAAQVEQDLKLGKRVLFIAIDEDTWHKGSGNRGIYAGWNDTHLKVKELGDKIGGVIVNRTLDIDSSIPQFVMDNTYEAIQLLGDYAFSNYTGNTIAITGTAGKSTTKSIFQHILSNVSNVTATRGNHNTRTGVPLTVATSIHQPEHLIIEVAISALWMRSGGIMKKYPPNIAIITSIDSGQKKSKKETAIQKSKIAEGMNHKGHVLLNRDMNEFDTVFSEVSRYNKNIITYGFHEEAEVKVISYEDSIGGVTVTADILGEEVSFKSVLHGRGMVQNLLAVLTALKLSDVSLKDATKHIESYKPNQSVQNIEIHQTKSGKDFTLINDAWNATPNSMIEAIHTTRDLAKNYKGKTIAVLGRIINLGEEAKERHESVAEALIDANIDLVFGHGEEIKHALKKLPETMIGGYYENSKELAIAVSNIIEEEDVVLIKGSARATDFKNTRDLIVKHLTEDEKHSNTGVTHPHANSAGAMTISLSNGKKVASYGNIDAIQNQGLGGALIINYLLDQVYAKKLDLNKMYLPGEREIKANKARKAIPLKKGEEVSLYTLLTASIFNHSPNALLMIAHQVIGSNSDAMRIIKSSARQLDLEASSSRNISGRRIPGKDQTLTLEDLVKVGRVLFNKYPFVLDFLAARTFSYKGQVKSTTTNLFSRGKVTHGLFFGHNDSIAITLTDHNGERYLSVALGAMDAYHRDMMLTDVINQATKSHKKRNVKPKMKKIKSDNDVNVSIIGDTYFGEFYTEIRARNNKNDALQSKDRNYSFDGLRPLLKKSDFRICNFEAAISHHTKNYMKLRKPFVLHADPQKNTRALKKEGFDLVTLGNNHLMDFEKEGLRLTVEEFNSVKIASIGAGLTQEDAEAPYVLEINGQRVTLFNAYWYRRPMYREFDFYAIGESPGVSSLSGEILSSIKKEKEQFPDGKVIVIAHWGVDFLPVHNMQRMYANSLVEAGADLIIGHGAHMIQKVEKISDTPVVYSIGNGVFNSNGEYNRRHVAPYSMVANLKFGEEIELKLYPFYCNNLKTFWQPRFLDEKEFLHCTTMLRAFGSMDLESGTDEDGRQYYSLKL